MTKILALIPAREGSKGIKDKNITSLAGNPLIYYTIREAKKVKHFQRVFVSTDSNKIKRISESYGMEVPFLRPKELAGDDTKTIDVVIDVLKKLKERFDEEYDYVCLLQPTTPLRNSDDIVNCINLINEECSSVVSLTKIDEPHPYKMKTIHNNHIQPFIDGTDSSLPRQSLPEVYSLNGAVYLTDVQTITQKKDFFGKHSYPYQMPFERSVNINSIYDLELARNLIR